LVTAWSVAMERPSAAFAAKAPKINMRAVRKGACASDRILVRLLYFSSLFLGLDEGSSDAATRTVRVTARDCRRRRFVIVALVVVARVIAGVTRRTSARDDDVALGRAYVVADMFTAKADIVVGIDPLTYIASNESLLRSAALRCSGRHGATARRREEVDVSSSQTLAFLDREARSWIGCAFLLLFFSLSRFTSLDQSDCVPKVSPMLTV